MIRTEMDSMPTELDVLSRKIIQLEIEEAALKKETDHLSQAHLEEIQKELAEQRDAFKEGKARWENEKNAIGKVQKLREDLEAANAQLEKAQREYDLNKAAELQYGTIPSLKKQLDPSPSPSRIVCSSIPYSSRFCPVTQSQPILFLWI